MKIKLLFLTLILMTGLLQAQQNPQLGATLQHISSFNYSYELVRRYYEISKTLFPCWWSMAPR
jgi:hypothetical protein